MSIVNTCYTNELQEMENAEKINKQELDKMYEAYMKCLKQNENINDKIKILQEQNKKEVYSIKYLPIFPKEVNDIIREHLQEMKYYKIRQTAYRYVLNGIEKYIVDTCLSGLKFNYDFVLDNLKKNETPLLECHSGNFYFILEYAEQIKKLKTYEEKYDWLIRVYDLEDKICNVFRRNDYETKCFNDNEICKIGYGYICDYDIAREIFRYSIWEIIKFHLKYDKWFIDCILKEIEKFSKLYNTIWTKCKKHFDEGITDKVSQEQKAEYQLLINYTNSPTDTYTEYINAIDNVPIKYKKLMLENKRITVVNKNGTSINSYNIKIIMIDLCLYCRKTLRTVLYYDYVNMPTKNVLRNNRVKNNKFNYFKNELCWLIKNIVLNESMTFTKNKYELAKNMYKSIPSKIMEFSTYNNIDREFGGLVRPEYIHLRGMEQEEIYNNCKNGMFTNNYTELSIPSFVFSRYTDY